MDDDERTEAALLYLTREMGGPPDEEEESELAQEIGVPGRAWAWEGPDISVVLDAAGGEHRPTAYAQAPSGVPLAERLAAWAYARGYDVVETDSQEFDGDESTAAVRPPRPAD